MSIKYALFKICVVKYAVVIICDSHHYKSCKKLKKVKTIQMDFYSVVENVTLPIRQVFSFQNSLNNLNFKQRSRPQISAFQNAQCSIKPVIQSVSFYFTPSSMQPKHFSSGSNKDPTISIVKGVQVSSNLHVKNVKVISLMCFIIQSYKDKEIRNLMYLKKHK